MASIKEFVDSGIRDNNVIIYGKSWCSYSRRAKKYVEQVSNDFVYIDIDQRDDESEIQAYLRQLNGQSTVPHVYIRQKFIGGCSDLLNIPQPELRKRITGS